MPNYPVSIRVTRTSRCMEGFYALINGHRIWSKTRAGALESCEAILRLQRLQVVTFREYHQRHKRAKAPL